MKNTRKICGVGVNDADYKVMSYIKDSNGKRKLDYKCPYYSRWTRLLAKCYGKINKNLDQYKTYQGKGVVVCEDWHKFSNFLGWAKSKPNFLKKGYVMDKDLLQYYTKSHYQGKGKVYSPETCVVIPTFINDFIKSSKASRGELPIGAIKDRYNYSARISDQGKVLYIGHYLTPYEAHEAWRDEKIKLCFKYLDTIDCVIARTAFLNFTYRMIKDKAEGKVTDY